MRIMTALTDYTLCSTGKKFKFRVAVEAEGQGLEEISRRDFQEILYKTAETWGEILDGEVDPEEEEED